MSDPWDLKLQAVNGEPLDVGARNQPRSSGRSIWHLVRQAISPAPRKILGSCQSAHCGRQKGFKCLIFTSRFELYGAGEMAQWLRALAALPEDLGSNPSTHMAAHNCHELPER